MIDPVTFVVGILAAAVGKEVVKDAYAGLKGLLLSRFKGRETLTSSVHFLEQKPESKDFQEVVEKELRAAGFEEDAEVKEKTEVLRALLEQHNLMPGSLYQAKVKGSGAIAQGKGAVAAGSGGVAVGGSVHGNITMGDSAKDNK